MEDAAKDLPRSPTWGVAPVAWKASRIFRVAALSVWLYCPLSDPRSIELYRGPTWDRHYTLGPIQRSRDGLADRQGDALRSVGHGRGGIVRRHAPRDTRLGGAGVPGISCSYGFLFWSSFDT